ncbi:MAG: hypothetical protein IJ829_05435, partial [Kiritimatiellae bacterium]|nr:hypothetical protein [Kiritimatiellia bacterium]
MKKPSNILLALFGVVLPVAAFVVELLSDMCAEEAGFSPMPTVVHGVLVALVPVANLVLLVCTVRKASPDSTFLRAAAGFAVVVSIAFALPLVEYAFVGIIIACLFFWYFGFGLLGLLPCAPLAACVSALVLRRRLAKGPGFWRGALVAFLCLVVVWADAGAMILGARLSQSEDPAVAVRGVKLCRLSSRRELLAKICRRSGYGLLFRSWRLLPEVADGPGLYYRVTGEDPAGRIGYGWRSSRRGMIRWDWITGGDKVGGVLEGLSLRGSAWETTIDKVAGVGYGEWTMTFGNTYRYSDREARMRIALPHGAVVSRVTLWIDGEEREAAFGTKGQVRRAYESVVRRARDPLLVNVCGPDQVQVQCFPVPRDGGEMKIRVGITIPLSVAQDGKTARLGAPEILERNFAVAKDLPGLPEAEGVAFESALPRLSYYAEDGFAALTNAVILQTAGQGDGWRPQRIAVVLDTSACMRDVWPAVYREVYSLDSCTVRSHWVVDDMTPEHAWDAIPENFPCEGGRPNLRTLLKAVKSLGERGESAALVWIHGPQPGLYEEGDALVAALNKAENVRFYNVQVKEGPCPILEALTQSERVVSLTAAALAARRDGTFGENAVIASALKGGDWQTARTKVPKDELPEGAALASKHLGRLWAAEETARVFRPG